MFFWALETMSHKFFGGKKTAPPPAPAAGGTAPASAPHAPRKED
jgi:hypothetical protein